MMIQLHTPNTHTYTISHCIVSELSAKPNTFRFEGNNKKVKNEEIIIIYDYIRGGNQIKTVHKYHANNNFVYERNRRFRAWDT